MRDYKLRKRVTTLEETGGSGGASLYRHDIHFTAASSSVYLTIISSDPTGFTPETFISYVQGLADNTNISCSGGGVVSGYCYFPYQICKHPTSATEIKVYINKETNADDVREWASWAFLVDASDLASSFVDAVNAI